MALRASWTGHLKVSLVTVPVRLYNAVSSTSRIQLNQLHKGCNLRVKYDTVCPKHGHLDRDQIVKGYEFEKNRYVVIDDEDLEALRLETTKVIEVVQFSRAEEVDAAYLDAPYYVAPDGPIAAEGFATLREAMNRAGTVAIGRVVMSGREKLLWLRPSGKGLAMSTMHHAFEVRRPEPFFEDIPEVTPKDEEVALGEMLVARMSRPFDPAQFSDRYQEAMLEIIRAKIAGEKPVLAEERPVAEVVDLMEALKRSLEQEGGAAPPARGRKPAAASVPEGGGRRKRKA